MRKAPHAPVFIYAPPVWWLGWIAFLGLLVAGTGAPARANTPITREYQIKAAFLYNFTKFVEWAPTQFSAADAPLVIGVLGRNPFGDELANAIKGRQSHGRAITTHQFERIEDATSVHILFIPPGEDRLISPSALQELHALGVLSVGESPRFAESGGIITFATEAGKVRFRINRVSAGQGPLKFSAQLLKLALPDLR